jgi:RNA polymerase sigma factor (TIGR02999 family)
MAIPPAGQADAAGFDAGDADRQALDALVPLVYAELRRMARAQLARERERFTLDTTALVHEAYVRLADGRALPVEGRAYFFGAAARAMRRVLVDAARRRRRAKRGAGQRPLSFEVLERELGAEGLTADLVDLDEALEELGRDYPRQARVVECRYFGGLSVEETAATLDLAERTVKRDWAFARAWLLRRLRETGGAAPA